ncbi:MAG: HAMP domain-containing histidine kinase [Lewinellaceae bacterium]|nr:HAMP domain-containing histidine kinase [Lewinellaceae bacterium]
MKVDKIPLVIGASCLALIALVLFQVRWMQHSRVLLEEQFNNKVAMALCSAVESLMEDPAGQEARRSCILTGTQAASCCQELEALASSESLQKALDEAFGFYQVPLNYQAGIQPRSSLLEEVPPNSCSLEPLLESSQHLLSVEFPDKEEYILEKMGFMLGASILILIFISLVFLLANYTLIRQKRARERNADFFNHMAHEFRTPLTNIALASRLLGREKPGLEESRFFQVIQRENRQMMQRVEHVLHLAEMEDGASAMEREEVNLESLLRQSIQDMEVRIQASNARVSLSSEVPTPLILGDSFHLANAFRNLIDNAIKYSRLAPEIQISICRQGENFLIGFQDNGVGIGPEGRSFIFEKFQRLACDNLKTEKGFGLGLSYVKRIVDMHKGVVRVVSELGKGSRFVLALPALEPGE